MRGHVAREVAERAHRFGPLPYEVVLDLALYHEEHGFYAKGAGAGRDGDFVTSPEVGPLFGTVIAKALDHWWEELGRPDPYVVVEAGAGSGALAVAVLAATPACALALRYVLVERSPQWRERHTRRLPIEPPALVLGPMEQVDAEEGLRPATGRGPLVTSLPELPAGPFHGVVLANELLDNLAFRLLEHNDGTWQEVRVTADLTELLVEPPSDLTALAGRLVREPPSNDGARIPVQRQCQAWLRVALDSLAAGRVVAIDYADTTPSMATRPWTEWVRTYRGHGRGGHPLEHLGEQDVTCEVAVDQLEMVRVPALNRPQAEFLRAFGVDDLAAEARRQWEERAHIGDLEAVKARSRVSEADALTDPAALGRFRVVEWTVGGQR